MHRGWLAGVLACSACGFAPNGASGTGDAQRPIDARTTGEASLGSDAAIDAPPPPLDAYAGPPQFVQESVADPGWGNSDSVITSPTINTTAGDLIALYITSDDSASVDSVSDTGGNTYVVLSSDSIDDSGNGQQATTAYASGIAGGPIVITAHLSTGVADRLMIAHEVLGIATTNALDAASANHQSSSGTSTDHVDSGSKSTTTDGDYVFAATSNSANDSGLTITAGTGETQRTNLIPTGAGNPTASEDQIQAAHGSIKSTFTYSKSSDALTAEMAFKPANPPP